MKVLVTGAKGFVGRNLCAVLRRREDIELFEIDIGNTSDELDTILHQADIIFHLAGVNRPQQTEEFTTVNTVLTQEICKSLLDYSRAPKIVFSSSIQADIDNPYGKSKRAAEEALQSYSNDSGAEVVVYRLKNLFGKWCRPDYNSVTATFCYRISHDLPIEISDSANEVDLTYIDDVVAVFLQEVDSPIQTDFRMGASLRSYKVTLGELVKQIRHFHAHRSTLHLSDYSDPFIKALYATYISYLDRNQFAYDLDKKTDNRGCLAEFLKSPTMGQIFISRTKPGITRGNHFHHTKTEKFLVIQGEGIIRFRHIEEKIVIEYPVRGEDFRVVDIPPGYTHSIENVGETEMVTLFWSSEIYDSEKADTWFDSVV